MAPERTSGEWSTVAQQQAGIARVGQIALQNVGLDPVFDEALAAMAETLGTPLVALLEWSEESRDFGVRAAWMNSGAVPPDFLEGVRIPGGTDSLPGFVLLRGELVRAEDLMADARFRAKADEFGSPGGAALMAPVGWGGEKWGTLGAWTTSPRRWSDDDSHFVETLATTLGLILTRRAAEIARTETATRLELALDAARFGVFDWSARSDRIVLDDVARSIGGFLADPEGISPDALFETMVPEDRDHLRHSIAEAMQTTGRVHTRFRFRSENTGEIRSAEFLARVIDEPEPSPVGGGYGDPPDVRIVGVVGDITDQIEAEERLEASLQAEEEARRTAERARERAMLLAEASQRFAGSLDPDTVIESLTEFCVPTVADGCFVMLRRPGGGWRLMAARIADGSKRGVLDDLLRRQSELGWSYSLVDAPAVWGDGQSTRIEEIAETDLRRIAADEHHARLLLDLSARSIMTVPLRARGETIGVGVFFHTAASERRFDEDDQLFAEQLGDRAAIAWANGQLYESRNRVVQSLQDALLPPALPAIAGIDLIARYRVADLALDVGGDFYDVVELPDGTHGFVIGDVSGRGAQAAATTGLVRHSIRTAAIRTSEPEEILRQTNAAMADQIGSAEFCTATFVQVDTDDTGTVTITAVSAGHPPPILLRSDGTSTAIECRGTLLGVLDDLELAPASISLEPGDTLILYTDGLTEARRGDEFFGEAGILTAAGRLAGREADEIADGLITAVDEFATGQRDDRALLIARVTPADERG